MDTLKPEKIQALKNEVEQLHPLLKAIFQNDPSISRHEYTHGPTEMGADFVLVRTDPTLGDENYIGVIAKCGNIRQDHSDVKRQIEECTIERFFDSGKKKIYLNEIWIVCTGKVSNGAERKIHEDFRSRNIKFIDIDKLIRLIDTYYPHFWSEIPIDLGLYLRETLLTITREESYNSLGSTIPTIDVTQGLYEIQATTSANKYRKYNSKMRTNLQKAIENNRFIMIDGGMGSGKTTLFRQHVKMLCEPNIFQKSRTVSKIIHYSDIVTNIDGVIKPIIDEMNQMLRSIDGKKILLIIDGIDEMRSNKNGELLSVVEKIEQIVREVPYLSIILGSRPIWTIEEGEELLKHVARFKILPLTFEQIVKVIQKNCNKIGISSRLQQDLERSALMKALPRTPMSAILLARVLNADSKEIPQTLPELYSKYIELALGRWDISKGLMTEREYPVVIKLLSLVAKYMLENELHEMSISEALDIFRTYTKTREGLPAPEDLFERIAQRAEVIAVNKERNVFGFRHKSFAEFLLAQYQKNYYGRSAPLSNPFDGYWLGTEYFYLGLIQDAGERIDKLSMLCLESEREKIFRILNFSDLMLAAYQSEYKHIEKAVYDVTIEMTRYFLDVKNGKINSSTATLPEFHLFAIISFIMQDKFEYQYFRKALEEAQLLCQCDKFINEEERYIASFLIDMTRAGLGDTDIFQFLSNISLNELPWVVKLGIEHTVRDNKVKIEHVKRLAKRIVKSRKNNQAIGKYIKNLYEGSMRIQP